MNIFDYLKYEYLLWEDNKPKPKEKTFLRLTAGEWFWGIIFGGALITLTSGFWYPLLFG